MTLLRPEPRNIWCVGRNYADHANELSNPIPHSPLLFLKAGSCAIHSNRLQLPSWSSIIHYECEIAVRLNAKVEVTHLGLALDLTARDAQSEAKKKGEPWTKAKSFVGACPLSSFIVWDNISHFSQLEFKFSLNGQCVQHGFTKDMIFNLETLLLTLKNHFPVTDGDILLTGTPSGVGQLNKHDQLTAEIPLTLQHHWLVE